MAATPMKFGVPIDMEQLQILQFVFENRSADPTIPVNGQTWYNTTTNIAKIRMNGVTVLFYTAADAQRITDLESAVSSAESDITDIDVTLTAISSSNVLSAGEKPMYKLLYDTLLAEQSGLDALATLVSVTTTKTTYDNAVTALTSYLGALSPAYTDFATDTVIVGTTFATKFKDVLVAKTAIIIAIITAVWTKVGVIEATANNAEALAILASNQVLTQLNTIPVEPGDLNGAVSTIQAAQAAIPDVYEVDLTAGSSGTVTFEINGTSHDLEWDTSLEQSAIDFVTMYGAAGYTDIVITRDYQTLIFTQTNGIMPTINITENGISTSGAVNVSNYVAAIGQIDHVVLSGTGGMCTLNSNGATGIVYYSLALEEEDSLANTAADFVLNNSTEFTANGITLSSVGDTIILTQITPGTAFAPATESANIPTNTIGGITIIGNEIYETSEDSNQGSLMINMRGYNGGYSRNRNIYIGDGKGNTILKIDGASGQMIAKVPDIASPGTFHTGYLYYDGGTLKMS